MARFVRGDVVKVPFPFSSEGRFKARPSIALATWGSDVLLCVVTTRTPAEATALDIEVSDFLSGGLPRASRARCAYMYVAHQDLILGHLGRLTPEFMAKVLERSRSVLS